MQINNKLITFKTGIVLGAVLVASFLSGLNASAYGPERRTFTDQNPADYVTFNSITNNPGMGDERNFVRIREAGVGNYVDKIDIVPGKTYEVWTYVHNNASSTYNTREHNYKGVALDVRMKATLPAVVSKGQTARVVSTISAKNSAPSSVWDDAYLTSSQRNVILNYVQGSAHIATSNGAIKGMGLNNNDLFGGTGSLLGYSALNGAMPGCTQYTLTVVYKFTANYPDFETTKTVSKNGANAWGKDYSAKAGEKVDFRITYKNTGTVTQSNVNIQDILPAGLTLVKGTTKITTPSDPAGKMLNDDVVSRGINIGNYSIGGSATLTFTAQVDGSKLVCGINSLVNTSKTITENGTKSDTAKVTVNRDCTPKQEKEFCKVPGKGNLKKDDPNCKDDKCKVPGKENLKPNDPNCFEPCQIPGKSHLKKDDPNCKNGDKCAVPGKENLKPNDPNCFEPCEIKGKENLKKNDPNCAQIPSELPQTGPAEAAVMIIAVVAISGAVAYYLRSRQELKLATAETGEKGIKEKLSSKIKDIKSKILKK